MTMKATILTCSRVNYKQNEWKNVKFDKYVYVLSYDITNTYIKNNTY